LIISLKWKTMITLTLGAKGALELFCEWGLNKCRGDNPRLCKWYLDILIFLILLGVQKFNCVAISGATDLQIEILYHYSCHMAREMSMFQDLRPKFGSWRQNNLYKINLNDLTNQSKWKQVKRYFKSKNNVSTSRPMEQLHIDLLDPTRTASMSGK
ncbi:hypothetical protein CR513_30149, partial [Mucuna pruriens]